MKIEELLDKYFEGETSCEEERELRRFFTEEKVPEHLQTYRPLFAYLTQEAISEFDFKKNEEENTLARKEMDASEKKAETTARAFGKNGRLHRTLYALSGIAAGVLLLYSIGKLVQPPAPVPENYVIIDGIRHTDENLAKAKALEAMRMAGFTDEDLNGLLFGH